MGSPDKDSVLLLLGSKNSLPKTSGIVHLKTTQHVLWAFNQIKPQVQILPLQLAFSVTLGKWLCSFGPQFPFLQNVGECILLPGVFINIKHYLALIIAVFEPDARA